MDSRINETFQTGAVRNRTYRAGESVYLFLEFTIYVFPPPKHLVQEGDSEYIPSLYLDQNLSMRR